MARFDTTRWSMVLEARKEPAQARRALDTLCRNYRPPVLAYIRSHGYAGDAEDLTQAFFTRFVEQAYHRNADPERGRFRAYLLTALKRFLLDAEDQAHAVKRGGRVRVRSLETLTGIEDSGRNGIADEHTPDRAFQRAWVHQVIRTALRKLRNEAKAAGKVELFDHLSEFLAERPDEADYARVAEALNLRRNTLAVAVHRLRSRLRELVREQLADTAADGDELQRELRELRQSLEAAIG